MAAILSRPQCAKGYDELTAHNCPSSIVGVGHTSEDVIVSTLITIKVTHIVYDTGTSLENKGKSAAYHKNVTPACHRKDYNPFNLNHCIYWEI